MYFFFWQKNKLKLKLLQITKITDFEKLSVNKFSTTNGIRFNFLQVCSSAILLYLLCYLYLLEQSERLFLCLTYRSCVTNFSQSR